MKEHRILLVDDDRSLLRLLSMRLQATGYMVMTADSGEQALMDLPEFQPHLVITDLQMAGMDGMTLFRKVHAQNPLLPVLVLTAHGTIPGAIEAIRSGVFSYLAKPYNSRILLAQIAHAIEAPGTDSGSTDPWGQSRLIG